MSAYSDEIRNDAQGWSDSLNGIEVGGLSNSAPATEQPLPEDRSYDGTTCPDVTFTVFNVAAIAGSTVQTMDFEALWAGVAWFSGKPEAAQAVKDFEEDLKLAKGAFGVTRHFWLISHTGRIQGLLMQGHGCHVKAIAVAGFDGGYTGTKVAMRGEYKNLEAKLVKELVKQLKG